MATVKWTSSADGDWGVAADWSGGAMPGTADSVVLTGFSTITHSTGADTIAKLTSTGDTLAVSGGTLSVSAGASLGGPLVMTGGALILSGAANTASSGVSIDSGSDLRLTAKAKFAVAGGLAIGLGTVMSSAGTIEGPGTLATSGATTLASNYRVLTVGGGVTWMNTGSVTDGMQISIGTALGATAAFNNTATGTFDLTTDAAGILGSYVLSGGTYGTGTSTFGNAGLLEKTGGTGTSTLGSYLVNVGRLSVVTGELDLTEGGRLGGTISGGGTLGLAAGAFSLSSPKLASNTVLALVGGTLVLAKGQTVASVTARTGVIDGPGTLVLSGATTLTPGPSYEAVLTIGGGTTLVNHGTLIVSSGLISMGDASALNGALISNVATAVIDVTGDASIVGTQVYTTAVESFGLTNAGLLEKTGGSGTTDIAANLTSTGTISVTSGVLSLTGGGSLGGAITGGGTVLLSAGAFSLKAPKIAAGTSLVLSGGAVSIAAGSVLTDLIFTGGEIDGPGTLANGLNTTLAAGFAASLILGGGVHFTNTGTVAISTGGISAGDSAGLTAILVNAKTGVLDFTGDGGISNGYVYDTTYRFGGSTFSNAGVLEKTGGTGTSVIASVIGNTGTIKIATGTIDLTGGGVLGGAISGGGALALGGGLFTLAAPSVAAGASVILAGGTVAVAYGATLSHLKVSSGEIDGPGTFTTGLSITLAGSEVGAAVLTLGGGLIFSNTGTILLSTGGIDGGDDAGPTATLLNAAGGVFDFTGDAAIGNGYDFGAGSPTYGNVAMTNEGVLEKTGGSGISQIVAVLDSTGTIKVATGQFDLLGGGDISGTISGGGTILLGGGIFTLDDPIIDNATSIILAGGTVAIEDGTTLSTLGLLSGEIDGSGTLLTTGANQAGAITLAADAVWDNTGSISLDSLAFGGLAGGSGTLDNAGFATLRIATLGSGIGALVTNEGSFEVTNGDPLAIYDGEFDSTGSLTVDAGSFALGGGGALSGSLAGSGQLVLSAGTFTVAGLATQDGSAIVVAGGTMALVAGGAATFSGSLWEQSGALLLYARSQLILNGDAAFGVDFAATAHVDGLGTLVTTGQVTIADTDYTDGTALRLGGGINWTNSTFVFDAGFIRVGDGHGLKAEFVNTVDGVFEITTDDGGIGNNAVLSPAGVYQAGASSFANAGLLAKVGGAGQSFIASVITNTGTIDAASGTLDVLTKIAGTGGVLQIEAGSTLESVGFAATQSLVFDGDGATLLLDARQNVTTPITGFAVGDAIDLSFATGATAAITGSTLTITPSGQSALTFVSAASLAGDALSVASDGNGGTIVTLTAAHSAVAAVSATGAAAALNGHAFASFAKGAGIDVTDLRTAGLDLGLGAGLLSLSDGVHHAVLGLPGVARLTEIGVAADGHGGTLLSYHAA